MGYPTPIEWTDATWNPVGGCEILSPGCINCYAMRIAAGPRLRNHPLYRGVTKLAKGLPVFNGMLTALLDGQAAWAWPTRWRGAAYPKLGAGKPSLIFVGDMADLFHKRRPLAHIDRTVAAILASRHIGQLLTKRADVMADYFSNPGLPARLYAVLRELRPKWTPAETEGAIRAIKSKIWLGFSAERQQEFDERWRHIRPFAVGGWQVFVSCEPLLSKIVLPGDMALFPRKPWIITGGESGPSARPAHPDWFRLLRNQAEEYGLPFFFKQWGEYTGQIDAFDHRKPDLYMATDGRTANENTAIVDGGSWKGVWRLGKKKAGATFDNQILRQFPTISTGKEAA